MALEIIAESAAWLADYGQISIGFTVESVLEVVELDGGLGGLGLREHRVEQPWFKDYDAPDDNRPQDWSKRFDIRNWGLLSAQISGGQGPHLGGAVIAHATPGLDMLEGRDDLAVLWDIRVAPEARGQKVGSALFTAAEAWALERGCRWLKVETQTVNVPACRFYQRQGCVLGVIHRFAYPDLPEEVQVLWYKQLKAVNS
ncbi:MAG: GNAT family N-acetyltransferase [Candidatus Sericytochromatia bacterium]